MSAEAQVASIISNAQTTGNIARDRAISFSQDAIMAAVTLLSLASPPTPTRPNVVIPPFVNPNEDLGNEFKLELANAFADLDPKLNDDITDFINLWFPDFTACLKTVISGWICDTITNGASGIPRAVEDAIWQRERERELRDATRRESEAAVEFAGRGFSLPSGMLVTQIDLIRQDAANKVATASRDNAIEMAKIQIETIKFAVEQGVKLRCCIINALVDFIKAKVAFYDLIRTRAVSFVEAKRALWQSAAAYYSALVGAAGLVLKYDELRIDAFIRQQMMTVDFSEKNTHERVAAAVAAAEQMGRMAAAALGAQNTLGHIGHQTNVNASS